MLRLWIPRPRPTLPCGDHAVPSAQEGLTAVFGMGTGVSPPPWRPETLLIRALPFPLGKGPGVRLAGTPAQLMRLKMFDN